MERKVALTIRPSIDGLEEVESTLKGVMAHVMAALDGIERARSATLTVTALAEAGEPTE